MKINLSSVDIADIEKSLKTQLPDEIKEQYKISNGLLGPTDCQFLYTYKVNENTDLIRINKILKSEEWFPNKFIQSIFIGDDGCGNLIGYDSSNNKAFTWNPSDGDEIQEERKTIKEVWCYIENLYIDES